MINPASSGSNDRPTNQPKSVLREEPVAEDLPLSEERSLPRQTGRQVECPNREKEHGSKLQVVQRNVVLFQERSSRALPFFLEDGTDGNGDDDHEDRR